MTKEFVYEYISNKIINEGNFIRITFYDIRIKHNVSENEIEEFLREAQELLEKKDYQVYFTNAKYTYKHEQKIVQDNEYIIAIKESEEK